MINSVVKFSAIYFVLLAISFALCIFMPEFGYPLFRHTASMGLSVLHEIQGLVL